MNDPSQDVVVIKRLAAELQRLIAPTGGEDLQRIIEIAKELEQSARNVRYWALIK